MLMHHLVDAGGDREDEDIVLSWLDLHAVGIAYSEPFLGNFGYFVPALTEPANSAHIGAETPGIRIVPSIHGSNSGVQ